MGNFQRREEKAHHMQQRWPWHMDGSFSKGCSGATSRCPTVSPHHLPLGQRAEVNGCQQINIGTRWACNHPKCCESSFKGPWTFPKQTLLPFWFCYESRWNQVVLTEFLFEVWCGSQKSKPQNFRSEKQSKHQVLKRAARPRVRQSWRGPQSHREAQPCQPPPAAHVLHKHQTASLAKTPSPKLGGLSG